jgi:HPt (histidine-containing phosphotransfer) domain-containing protein
MKTCCEKYLNEQFGGDAEVVNGIYAEYVSSMHAKTDEADVAVKSGDWTLLDRVAHTIKGNALAAGDEEMAEKAIELRRAAQLQDAERVGSFISAIKELITSL